MLRLKQSPSIIAVCGSGTGKAVDEDMVGLESEGADGRAHRLVGGAQDIDRINLHGIDNPDRPRNRLIADEFAVNLFAAFGEELLRIVEPAMPEFFRENDRCGYDRPGQRASPRLIHAGDRGDTQGA